ncbi:hydroxyurea phosphotransferase [Nocardiopsis sp. CNT-189]|uniref:aminoglycoside phosphotransferase family protein n=1 Tax=Nocardiopsis oceanisediminis TaxID=2816862 RepID=UPI003B37CC41
MTAPTPIDVPDAFTASYPEQGAEARAWLASLPRTGAELLERWDLRPDGPTAHGMASIVLPVRRADGSPAALRLQQPREEATAASIGLRTWRGDGIVRLLDGDDAIGGQLLERLDASRPLSSVADDGAAVQVLAELLARLTSVPAPAGLRSLAGVAGAMLDRAPGAASALRDPADRRLVRTCASAVAELVAEPGDRLLHWDLHYGNVLAAEREPWLAIDPEPLAGDPGFDLLPALDNRWDEAVATGDPGRAVLGRFDRLTEVLGLDRGRATGWTLGRVLQNALWDVEDGKTALDPAQVAIAGALLGRSAPAAARSAERL